MREASEASGELGLNELLKFKYAVKTYQSQGLNTEDFHLYDRIILVVTGYRVSLAES